MVSRPKEFHWNTFCKFKTVDWDLGGRLPIGSLAGMWFWIARSKNTMFSGLSIYRDYRLMWSKPSFLFEFWWTNIIQMIAAVSNFQNFQTLGGFVRFFRKHQSIPSLNFLRKFLWKFLRFGFLSASPKILTSLWKKWFAFTKFVVSKFDRKEENLWQARINCWTTPDVIEENILFWYERIPQCMKLL